MNTYVIALLISLLVNVFFFIFAYLAKTDKLTDFTYGLSFILVAVFLFLTVSSQNTFALGLLAMIIIWAIRLIIYLVIRIHAMGRDKRFDEMREKFWSFFRFWFFQALSVWVILLPATYAFNNDINVSIQPAMVFAIMVWAFGLGIETVADMQKFIFKQDKVNKGKWIQSGLWAYSRHPNYFGEMMLWWGVFLYILPLLSGFAYLTVLGPLYISFILRYVSGVPLLEKKYNKRYAENEDYQDYKNRTSLLILLPKKKVS